MCKKIHPIVLIFFMFTAFEHAMSDSESDEYDSGSIELPNRPENRQADRMINSPQTQDPQTLLHLLSKLLQNVKQSIRGSTQKVGKNQSFRRALHKTRKAFSGLYRVYNRAERIGNKIMKRF